MTPKSNTKAEREGAFKDVSSQVEQAQKDAEQPAEFDESGNLVAGEPSQAAVEVAEEQARRASATANGGGPWPEEVLRKRFVGTTRMQRPEPVYTSHEDAES